MRLLHAFAFALPLALAPTAARAEKPPAPVRAPAPPDPAAIAARERFLDEQKKAMTMLAGWAAASMASGAMLWATAEKDDYTRAVGIQTLAWGAVDGVIAGFGGFNAHRQSGLDKPVAHWEAEGKKMRRIFLVNAGLDVLYIATGAALMGFGKTDFVRGTGAGIALQGGFLLAFDTAFGLGAR
ncbi:DUF6992 family protein [Polyangium aurulentum]|uniref:DUF6992 family protein n=1 Tax=Polyangium aurulentum TaxID=2567896 RepID=UPI0010AECE8C|nr:hypothetical protein [Polyangium aurulentum]UQA58693.1 hypothetical protein E8A73_046930 [Polyangium aurulentum]